jgi:hypothetical protein
MVGRCVVLLLFESEVGFSERTIDSQYGNLYPLG